MSLAPSTPKLYTNKLIALISPIPRFLIIFLSVYLLPIILFIIVFLLQQNNELQQGGLVTIIYIASSYLIILLYALITLLIGALSVSGAIEMILFLVMSLLFGVSYAIVLNNLKLIFNRTTSTVKQKSIYLKTASGLALIGVTTGLVMLTAEILNNFF